MVAIVTVVPFSSAPPREVELGGGLMVTLSGVIVADLRVAGAEGHDLRLVSAAEVTQRDGLHLVDRRWFEETYALISCWLRCEK